MSIIDRMIEWRDIARKQNTSLERITLFPSEYREMQYRLTGEMSIEDIEPGFKGFFMDTPLYVRAPLNLRVFNDAGQYFREGAIA